MSYNSTTNKVCTGFACEFMASLYMTWPMWLSVIIEMQSVANRLGNLSCSLSAISLQPAMNSGYKMQDRRFWLDIRKKLIVRAFQQWKRSPFQEYDSVTLLFWSTFLLAKNKEDLKWIINKVVIQAPNSSHCSSSHSPLDKKGCAGHCRSSPSTLCTSWFV